MQSTYFLQNAQQQPVKLSTTTLNIVLFFNSKNKKHNLRKSRRKSPPYASVPRDTRGSNEVNRPYTRGRRLPATGGVARQPPTPSPPK